MEEKRKFRYFKNLLGLLWREEATQHSILVMSLAFIFLSILINISIPLFFKRIIEVLSLKDHSDMVAIFSVLSSYLFIWILAQSMIQLRRLVLHAPLVRTISSLSARVFHKLHSLPVSFHVNKNTGEISSIILKAQESIPNLIWGIFFYFLPNFLELILATIILGYYYGLVYSACLIFTLSIFIFFTLLTLEKLAIYQSESNKDYHRVNAFMSDSLANFMTVKHFNTINKESEKFVYLQNKREESFLRFLNKIIVINIGQTCIIGAGMVAIVYIAGYQISNGSYNVSDFVLINGYVMQFTAPLNILGMILKDIRVGFKDLEGFINILNAEREVTTKKGSLPLREINTLTLQGVYFSYNDRPVLKDINFEVHKGQTIAIMGATGEGKSTIVNLLLGFCTPSAGKILFNKEEANSFNSENINELISIIPQDITGLFNASVYENICYGNQSSTKEELDEVIRLTELTNLINNLSNKENSIIGERGIKLSGGEKQRIIIARGLLKKASVYILDEATSALDIDTEKRILARIHSSKKESINIIITHNPQILSDVDKVLLVKNGTIVENNSPLFHYMPSKNTKI